MGILCLTSECLGSPWLLFEAGALAKKVENSRVCPLLIDLSPSDVKYPLAAFQLKGTDEEGIKGIVEMVNKSRGADALSEADLEEAFENRWPQFAQSFKSLPAAAEQKEKKGPESKVEKTLDEVLGLVRGIANNQAAAPPVVYYRGTQMLSAREFIDNLPIVETGDMVDQEQPLELHSAESVAIGDKMLKFLRRMVREQKPLISSWVGVCHNATYTDRTLTLYFPVHQKMFVESLSKPNNHKFLLSIVEKEFGVNDLRLVTLKQ